MYNKSLNYLKLFEVISSFNMIQNTPRQGVGCQLLLHFSVNYVQSCRKSGIHGNRLVKCDVHAMQHKCDDGETGAKHEIRLT